MIEKITKENIMPILEQHAAEIKKKYDDVPWEFLGGRFEVHIGIFGLFVIEVNSHGRIMKIKTPEGAYLRP